MVGCIKIKKSKNVKDIFFVNVGRKNIFDIYVTEYGTALTTILPILFLYLNTEISNKANLLIALFQ
jgi:hypothetical protein